MSPEGMISTKQAAEIIGITARAIVKLCKSGMLQSEKFGRVYLVDAESVNQYAANRPKPGPKVGSRRKKPKNSPTSSAPLEE